MNRSKPSNPLKVGDKVFWSEDGHYINGTITSMWTSPDGTWEVVVDTGAVKATINADYLTKVDV